MCRPHTITSPESRSQGGMVTSAPGPPFVPPSTRRLKQQSELTKPAQVRRYLLARHRPRSSAATGEKLAAVPALRTLHGPPPTSRRVHASHTAQRIPPFRLCVDPAAGGKLHAAGALQDARVCTSALLPAAPRPAGVLDSCRNSSCPPARPFVSGRAGLDGAFRGFG
jgi:hypothetical protein